MPEPGLGTPEWRNGLMSVRAAITIKRTQEDIARLVGSADYEPFGDDAEVTYAPAPGGRGTEVRVVLRKGAPGGAVGQLVAAVVGSDPKRQLDDALRRLKQILETGQVVRSDGSPDGTDAKQQRSQRPSQPVTNQS
jgi:uncharacterized membrane protein